MKNIYYEIKISLQIRNKICFEQIGLIWDYFNLISKVIDGDQIVNSKYVKQMINQMKI